MATSYYIAAEKGSGVGVATTRAPMISEEEPAPRDQLEEQANEYGASWDSASDPQDPHNWPSWRKYLTAVIYSLGQLVTLMTASMTAAALDDISRDLKTSATTVQITFSIYFVGLGLGPFLIAPLAETVGRKPVWVWANVWFVVWNALCPVGNSLGMMVAGRFLASLGASAGVTLTAPAMADMYRASERGKSLAIAAFLPYLGPALGPICGGLVTEHLDWRTTFWIMSGFNAAVAVIGVLFLRESYAPVLLRRKAAALQKRHREGEAPRLSSAGAATSVGEQQERQMLTRRLSAALRRPLRLLLRRPVVQLVSLSMGLNFAVYCLLLSTLATLYMERYGQSEAEASLHYISISVGSTLSALVGGRAMDWVYRRMCERGGASSAHDDTKERGLSRENLNNPSVMHEAKEEAKVAPSGFPDAQAAVAAEKTEKTEEDPTPTSRRGRPEFRVPYMIPAFILVPSGLLWYGWAAAAAGSSSSSAPWPLVDAGAVVFTLGSFMLSQSHLAYLLDEFGASAAASAGAAARLPSYLLAFAFPVFAPALYGRLGYGWGNTVLAGCFVALGWPVPAVLWWRGQVLRAKGRDGEEREEKEEGGNVV